MKQQESWVKVTVKIDTSVTPSEEIAGILASELVVPVLEIDGNLTIYLPGEDYFDKLLQCLRKLQGIVSLESDRYQDRMWEEEWKKFIKPVRVGKRIVVRPSWHSIETRPDDIEIMIDPEMAFGTGHHETTQLCLEWLEQFIDSTSSTNELSLLDVGTGSGILAIGAAKMGFGLVVGIDIDPVAILCARKNAVSNDVLEEVFWVAGSLDALRSKFDVVIANIQSGVLCSMAESLVAVLKDSSKSRIILSGILTHQATVVEMTYAALGCKKLSKKVKGEWCCIAFGWSSKARESVHGADK